MEKKFHDVFGPSLAKALVPHQQSREEQRCRVVGVQRKLTQIARKPHPSSTKSPRR